jgi:hypothetical protein
MSPERGPFLNGFAAWLDSGHGLPARRATYLRDANEFLQWYEVNRHHDVDLAARSFAEYGTAGQAASMRLLLEWIAAGG